MSRVLLLSLLLIFPSTLSAADVFVSPGGNDQAPGKIDRPFRTIQRAVDGMAPGDTCWLREGVYRETVTLKQSGTKERPIHIRAYPGELPILDGTEPIAGPWRRERDGIFATKTAIKTAQLFANDEMLVEARWPNCTPDKMLTREGWMSAGPKSEYQKIHSPELAKTGADWNGALAVLNVAHQFWTWSRVVEGYTPGSEFLPYTITMNEFHTKSRRWWDDDYFYLQGKREALDAAGEWLQTANGTLLLIPRPGAEPEMLQLKAKQRDYGFVGTNLHHVQISGITFFGCTFRLTTCEDCLVEFCNLSYPSYARGVPNAEEKGKTRPCPGTYISGRRNTIRSCSFEHCPNYGVLLGGEQNVIENSIVHDVNWAGTLHYTAVALTAGKEIAKPRNVARGNTLYNVGNSIITCHGPESIVEYNHVHHGGLISSDVSLIYTSMPSADGLEFRYNWVHDSLSPNHSLGIRGDDKTRGLHVHHNVVWNTAKDGIITKGGRNRVYNNTCFANGASDICYNSGREPDKWWQQHVKAYQNQNEDSLLINNAAPAIVSTRHRLQPPLPGDASNNFTERDARLMDVEKFDFRPQSDSPLVDAGRAVAGITAPFQGKAPDIGAYEFGGENWRPGHHNGIWLSRVAGDFSVRLNLPILEPVLARVTRNGQTLASLQFTPENWSRTQALPTAQSLAGSGPLSFAVDDWGTAVVPDVAAVTGLADARALFSRSDITSAKVVDSRPKFNYELSYTADLVVRPAWRAYFTKTPPTVDGIIRSSEWPGWDAARSITLVGNDTQADNAVAGEGYALFDDNDLYLAVKVANDGNPPSQSAEVWGQSGTDGIELAFARMSHGRATKTYLLRAYPSGKLEVVTTDGLTDAEAKSLTASVKYATRQIGKSTWDNEFRIPLRSLGLTDDKPLELGFNVLLRRSGAKGGGWFAAVKTDGPEYEIAKAGMLQLDRSVRVDAPNLLKKGTFESENLSPWRTSSNSREPLPADAVQRIRAGLHGDWCIRLQADDAKAMKQRVIKWTHPATNLPKSVRRYCLSYNVRIEGDGLTPQQDAGSFNSYLRIQQNKTAGSNLGQTPSALTSTVNRWIRRDLILQIPTEAQIVMLSLQLHQATGTVLVDNVSLLPCPE